jgi:hypothetical protein
VFILYTKFLKSRYIVALRCKLTRRLTFKNLYPCIHTYTSPNKLVLSLFLSLSVFLSRMVAGVIMDPYRDELFWASVGGGAYLNGDRGIAPVFYFAILGCFWLFFASVGRFHERKVTQIYAYCMSKQHLLHESATPIA